MARRDLMSAALERRLRERAAELERDFGLAPERAWRAALVEADELEPDLVELPDHDDPAAA